MQHYSLVEPLMKDTKSDESIIFIGIYIAKLWWHFVILIYRACMHSSRFSQEVWCLLVHVINFSHAAGTREIWALLISQFSRLDINPSMHHHHAESWTPTVKGQNGEVIIYTWVILIMFISYPHMYVQPTVCPAVSVPHHYQYRIPHAGTTL